MRKKKSLIGQTLVPTDNSYQTCITTKGRKENLAGSIWSDPKQTVIVSEPYLHEATFSSWNTHTFINVSYDGDIFRTLFYEWDVNADIHARIMENEQHKLKY